jgi:hypothetical protein
MRWINRRRWVALEIHLLTGYMAYWEKHTKARWLLGFNRGLCEVLIAWYYFTGLPYRPPTFNPWYVRLCHNYFRWRAK